MNQYNSIGIGGTAIAQPPAKRTTHVQDALESLNCETEQLHKNLEEIGIKLSPVLMGRPEAPMPGKAQDRSPVVELANRLLDQRMAVQAANVKLRNLIESLEL